MKNEIILPHRLSLSDIISGKIDHFIRLSDINKWTKNSVFDLKSSYISPDGIEIIILSSEPIRVQDIPLNILTRCGYKSESEFREQWTSWFQEWNAISTAWLIHFTIKNNREYMPIEFDEDMFA